MELPDQLVGSDIRIERHGVADDRLLDDRRGVAVVEPTPEAQHAHVRHFREIEIDTSPLLSECTPSYHNNEGERDAPWQLLRGYGHGWNAFQKLLAAWREDGRTAGLRLS